VQFVEEQGQLLKRRLRNPKVGVAEGAYFVSHIDDKTGPDSSVIGPKSAKNVPLKSNARQEIGKKDKKRWQWWVAFPIVSRSLHAI
jgi:hypothetical protein